MNSSRAVNGGASPAKFERGFMSTKRVFKVKTPSGVFADGEWGNRSEIPAKLPDRFEQYFDTAEAEIVEVLVSEKYTSNGPEPLKTSEWFDCPNDCDVRKVAWKDGDAFCSECGEMGCVYIASKRNRK